MPLYLMRLDRKDYELVDKDVFNMSPSLSAKFRIARGMSCLKEV